MLSDWVFRLRALLRPSTVERELDEELNAHVEHQVERLVGAGMPRDEALRRALLEFGGVEQIKEECRDARGIQLVDDAWRDACYAARVLLRQPVFTLVVVGTLALGIGANAAIFHLLDAVEFRALAVREPQQLVEIAPSITSRWGNATGRRALVTFAIWDELRKHHDPFAGMFAWGAGRFDLSRSGESRLVDGIWVSGGFFDVLGVTAATGRVLTPSDDVRGCGSPGVVISHAFWQREFGGGRVVGRTIHLDGHPLEIVGVTAAGFSGVEVGRSFDVAVPLCAEPLIEPTQDAVDKRHFWWLDVFGRLKPGWTVDRSTRYLETIAPSLFEATAAPAFPPEALKTYKKSGLRAEPAGSGVSYLRGRYRQPLWILLALSGLVQAIACANLANLLLVRASSREREIAVRLAIGASRGRLVRQLLAESLVLTAMGAALGTVLAQWVSRSLIALISTDADRLFFDLGMDWRVMAFIAALAGATCILFGLVPALTATRRNVAAAVQAGRRSSDTREGLTLRRVLVSTQVALSLVLVVGAALFASTLWNLASVDTGFRTDNTLVANFDVQGARVPAPQAHAFEREMLSRIAATPGVELAAEAAIVPASGSVWNDRVVIDGDTEFMLTNENHVSPGFFRLLGTPILAGRDFDERDVPGATHVAIVNRSFAQRFLKTGAPIGRTFRLQVSPGEPDPVYEVIGVVADTRYNDLREPFGPIAYFPQAQDAYVEPLDEVQMLIRGRIPIAQLTAAITAAAREVNPALLVRYRTLAGDIQRGFLRERLMATLSGFFGMLAALLASIGLYGTMSYTVARRRNEIGIRLSLGAERRSVVGLVVRDAALFVAVGLGGGLVLTLAVSKATRSLLFGVAPWDPATLVGATLGLALISAVAAVVPAVRASRLDPKVALREE